MCRTNRFQKRKEHLGMYEGQSFSRKYTDYCEQRKRRRSRTRRLVFGVFLAVCVAALALVLSDRLLPIEVWATPEKDSKDIQEIDFGAIQPEESEPEEEPEPEQNNTPVIFIDAGHGGNDGGCVEDGIIEKEINLAIARLVRDKLKELGYQVVMSRSVDRYVAKEDRVRKANEIQADIYVSIHQNSSDERSVNGMEVWYDGTDAQRDSRRLALLDGRKHRGSRAHGSRGCGFSCDRQHADASVPDRDRFLDQPGGAHKARRGGVSGEDCDRDCAGHRVLFSSQNDVLDL